jgi:hypothetical protein
LAGPVSARRQPAGQPCGHVQCDAGEWHMPGGWATGSDERRSEWNNEGLPLMLTVVKAPSRIATTGSMGRALLVDAVLPSQ